VKPERFAEGLIRLGLAVRQAPDAATLSVYFDSLGDEILEDEWNRFTRWAAKVDRFTPHFPKLAELRAALREFRGAMPLEAEAALAYDRVIGSGTYQAQGGTTWNARAIRERCGAAAAEAFLAAGGHHAFATTWNEAQRRERFNAAYCVAVRQDASTGLLSSGHETKALPETAPPSVDEARRILRNLAGRRTKETDRARQESERVAS
jgi:hypothetical protein